MSLALSPLPPRLSQFRWVRSRPRRCPQRWSRSTRSRCCPASRAHCSSLSRDRCRRQASLAEPSRSTKSTTFGMIGRLGRVWSQSNLICLGDAENAEASVATSGRWRPLRQDDPVRRRKVAPLADEAGPLRARRRRSVAVNYRRTSRHPDDRPAALLLAKDLVHHLGAPGGGWPGLLAVSPPLSPAS